MLKNPAFFFNAELCTGCKACMIACKDKHNLDKGILWRRVVEYAGGNWIPVGDAYEQNVFAYYISLSCNHCENPACTKACPTTAMHKDENGIVSVDPDKCVGCHYCEWNCPYGAPQFDATAGKMTKCDFCRDNLAEAQPPACVAACPCRALDFGTMEELQARHGLFPTVAPLPDPAITTPHLICAPNRHSQPRGSTIGRISNPEEV